MSSSGKIITGTGIQDGSIALADLAANSVDSSKIVDASIVDADVSASAALALSKIVHVGAGNILRSNGTTNAAGQIQTGDLIANAATQAIQSSNFSQATTNPPWTWISGSAQVSLTTAGGPVLVILMGSSGNTSAGQLNYLGHAQDSNTTADFLQYASAVLGSGWQPHCVVGLYTPSAGGHTWYGTCGCSGGTITVQGYMMAIEFKR